jgi:hypothetical protein
MKKTGPNKNISKVKVALAGDRKGTAHLFELRSDGLHVTFLPGKGNHKHVPPPRCFSFAQLGALRELPALARKEYGSPAEELNAVLADVLFVQPEFAQKIYDPAVVEGLREQLRRAERALAKL